MIEIFWMGKMMTFLLMVGCSNQQDILALPLDDEVVEEKREAGILLEGRLFYNDLRSHGRFEYHLDREGRFGTKCSYHSDDCRQNYLSAIMVEAQLLRDGKEVDTAVVEMDGRYSFVLEEAQSISLRFRLRFCNEQVCFSVRDDNGNIYSVLHPSASIDNPLSVVAMRGYLFPDVVFQPRTVNDGQANNHAHAINHYMGLGEVIYDWNILGETSFEQENFGELVVTMPAVIDTVGQTRSFDDVQIPENTSTWIKGQKIGHEYGHVLQLRSWDGEYWFDGPKHPSWSAKTEQRNEIAFKEGWANFIPKTVYPTLGCEGSFDNNDSSSGALVGEERTGHLYPRNVTKFLCDIYDVRNEADPDNEEQGDRLSIADVKVIYSYLEDVLNQATAEQRKVGLGLCDFIFIMLQDLPEQSEEILSTARHNRIHCGLY